MTDAQADRIRGAGHRLPDDLRFLKEVEEMAKTRLDYVYTGNVAGESHSYCPECRNVLVERTGYEVSITGIRNKKCSKCGRNADFVL